MLLDLRRNSRLLGLDCTGNQITALVLPEKVGLGWLKCGRNQLLTLDLRSLDALVQVVCSRNVLRRLVVGAHPRLELLDCSDNELAEVEFSEPLPVLRQLACGNNSLAQIPATWFPSLRVLDAHRNYIDRLDVRTNVELESLDVRKNQLERLRLSNPRLQSLDCGNNRLASLDLSRCPALIELRCPRNELEDLPLDLVQRLCGLWCGENRITALDLEPVPHLTILSAEANPIRRLDVRPVADLAQLEVASVTEVVCTEVQRDRLFSPPLSRARPDATPGQLHNLVRTYRGPNAERFFLEIVTLPQCDRGTALMAYWTSNPHQYARHASREELSAWELDGWVLVTAIEDRVRKAGFPTNDFRFYPRTDRQTRSVRGYDWVGSRSQEAVVREIPPELMEQGAGEAVAGRSTRAPA